MATNLYETLGVSNTATPEEIRRAYKKRALQTHPDRLRPNPSPEEKAKADAEFTLVNNAYEILMDPQKRRVYDSHGVFPPPVEEPIRRSRTEGRQDYPRPPTQNQYPRGDSFPDPYSNFPQQPFPSFPFTDPFVFFDSVFGDAFGHRSPFHHQHHHREHSHGHRHHHVDPLFDAFRRMNSGFFEEPHGGNFFQESTAIYGQGSNSGLRWAEETHMKRTVNGVTERVHKRRDWDGNEHITRTYPDGRQTLTINGIEQPSHSYSLPAYQNPNDSRGYLPPHSSHPIDINQQYANNQRSDYVVPPPPPPPYYSSPPSLEYSRHRERAYSDSAPVIPNVYENNSGHPQQQSSFDRQRDHSHHRQREDPHHQSKKGWWRPRW